MMSKISFNKSNPFWNMFLFTIKKNIPITILGTVISVLFMPILTVSMAMKDGYSYDVYVRYIDTQNLQTTGLFVLLISCGMVVLLSIINLGYLHNKSASDVYHALPISRKSLLLARWLPVWICSFIPMVASILAMGILSCFVWPYNDISTSGSLIFLGIGAVGTFICSVTTALLMVLTGNIFDMFVSQLAINIGIPAILSVLQNYSSTLLFGYSDNYGSESSYLSLSPFGFFVNRGWEASNYLTKSYDQPYFPFSGLVWLVMGTLMLIITILLYKKRRSEAAGEPYSGKILPRFLQIIVGIGAAIILGQIFESDYSFGVMYFVFAFIGSLLGAVVLGAIIRRSFRGIKTDLIIGTISMALLGLVFVVLFTGGLGYENRVPSASDVQSVDISLSAQSTLTQKENIQKVLEFHKEIVKNKNEIDDSLNGGSQNVSGVNITYHLKFGRTMERYLPYPSDVLKKQVDSITLSDEFLKTYYTNISSFDMLRLEVNAYNIGSIMVYLKTGDAKRLVDAYIADLKSGAPNDGFCSLLFSDTSEATNYPPYGNGLSLSISQKSKKTLAVLNEMGYQRILFDKDQYKLKYNEQNGITE